MTYISAFQPLNEKGFVDGDDILVYECVNHKNKLRKYPGIFEFYIKDPNGEYTSIFGDKLSKFQYKSFYDFRQAKKQFIEDGYTLFESDIKPTTKVLMEHYNGAELPSLNIMFYDIESDVKIFKYSDDDIVKIRKKGSEEFIEEPLKMLRQMDPEYQKLFECYNEPRKVWQDYLTSKFSYDGPVGWSKPEDPYAPINAISIFKVWKNETIVLAVPPNGFDIEKDLNRSLLDLADIRFFKNENDLLLEFLYELEECNILSGYNSESYDDPYIANRIIKVLGDKFLKRLSMKHSPEPKFKTGVDQFGKPMTTVEFGGRIQLDYMLLLKKFEQNDRSSWKLENISAEFLPHLKKLEYTGTLEDLYNYDFNHFLKYNLRDSEILDGLEKKLNYIALASQMIHQNCNAFRDVFGTVGLVDTAIINYCHHDRNVIVPDVDRNVEDGSISGAMVLLPQVGKHKFIGSIDINSLYPSAIRAINNSPETLIGQFTNNIHDWECIYNRTEKLLTVEFIDGSIETKLTSEWIEYFLDNLYAISAYGTIFDQKNQGIIPALLENWYTMRKKYNKLKKEYNKKYNDIKFFHGTLTPSQMVEYDLLENDKDRYDYKCKNAIVPDAYLNEYEEYYSNYGKYDRFQYTYKILLNSTYGALTNKHFRFFKLILGESVTCTGRMILKHQTRQVNKIFEGNYNIDFPLYTDKKTIDTMNKKIMKKMSKHSFDDLMGLNYSKKSEDSLLGLWEKEHSENHTELLSYDLALHGPKFNGKFESDCIIYGDSVAGDTIIYLEDRAIFIEDLMTDDIIHKDGKDYCNLNGIKALTYDKNNDETCYRDIKYVMRHKCEKQMYRVWTSENSYIDLTEDHSLMHYDGKTVEKVKPFDHIGKLISFEGFKTNNLLVFEHIQDNFDKPLSKKDALYFVGWATEIGWTTMIENFGDDYYVRSIELYNNNGSGDKSFYVSDVYKVEKIDYDGYVYDIEINDTHTFYANNILVHNTDSVTGDTYVDLNGSKKTIEEWFEELSSDGRLQYGKNNTELLYVSDCKTPCINSQTYSMYWSYQDVKLIYRHKTSKHIYKISTSSGKFVKVTQDHSLMVFDGSTIIEKKPTEILKGDKVVEIITDRYLTIEIVTNIEYVGYVDDHVYDIEMLDSTKPYFFGNDILVHNSTYFTIPVDDIKDAIEISDHVAECVNKSYPKFMRKAFFCNDGYKDLIQCARENVASSGIFVSKKMYTLRVVDAEGEAVDKMKTMGLSLKKTTIPKAIAKKLSEFVRRILLDEDWKEISMDILNYKKSLKTVENILNLGLPKGVNSLEDYFKLLCDVNNKKTIPGHVMASVCYNMMLKEHNDNENFAITSGTKIKTYYFKKPIQIEVVKNRNVMFKSIALPTDLEAVPEWFGKNIIDKLDIDIQVEKLVDDSLKNILEVIDYIIPTDQSIFSEELFEF